MTINISECNGKDEKNDNKIHFDIINYKPNESDRNLSVFMQFEQREI